MVAVCRTAATPVHIVPSVQRRPRHSNRVCADFIGRFQALGFLLILFSMLLNHGCPAAIHCSLSVTLVNTAPCHQPCAFSWSSSHDLRLHRWQRPSRLIDARCLSCTALHRCSTFPRVLNKSYSSSSVRGVSLWEQKTTVCIYIYRESKCVCRQYD